MTKYSTWVLNSEESIKRCDELLASPTLLNVAKVATNQSKLQLVDGQLSRRNNIHRFIWGGHCSCGLSVSKPDESLDVQEHVFRSQGHIDHTRGALTKTFVRKWPAIGLTSEFYCWWCVECGYLGEVKPGKSGKPKEQLNHECPSDRLRRQLRVALKKNLVKPGTKPVVAGADSWNAAISKAISLLGD